MHDMHAHFHQHKTGVLLSFFTQSPCKTLELLCFPLLVKLENAFSHTTLTYYTSWGEGGDEVQASHKISEMSFINDPNLKQ